MVGEMAVERLSPRQPFTLAAMSTVLPVEALWELYSLDPFTGTLYSRRTGKKMRGQRHKTSKRYTTHALVTTWNGQRFHRGYGRTIHAWINGNWSSLYVDHEDQNSFNHSVNNLRELTPRQNRHNSKTFKGGAYKHKLNGRWYARIWIDKRCKYLGGYATQAEAQAAYAAALAEL
jgi:hypothetical protein